VYWTLGLVGLPFYAGSAGGWTNGTGATMGYLVGFVVAAGMIGYLAERRGDRNLASSWSAMHWAHHHLRLPSRLAGPQAETAHLDGRHQRAV